MRSVLLIALFAAVALAARVGGPVPFSWSNCGAATDPVQIKSLSVSPSPVVFNANITFSASVTLTEAISDTTASSLVVDIKKQIGPVYVSVPCLKVGNHNVGSCTYTDPCTLLGSGGSCPPFLQSCVCPFPANTYNVPSTSQFVPPPPSDLNWLTDGNYQIQAALFDGSGNRVFCYQFAVSLSD